MSAVIDVLLFAGFVGLVLFFTLREPMYDD
jgi:hypothetical protein